MQNSKDTEGGFQNAALKPYGSLVSGKPGVSAPRLAEALDVPVPLIKRLARPVGRMKISYYNPF
jgi:hypothetical protein